MQCCLMSVDIETLSLKENRQILDVYKSTRTPGNSPEVTCCLPVQLKNPKTMRVGKTGRIVRLSLAAILIVLTIALIGSGQAVLKFYGSSITIGFPLSVAIIAGFFGVSFLIAGLEGYPGCEVMAIPNIVAGKKYYMPCIITPFNLPNGRWLEPLKPSGAVGKRG